MLIRMADVGGGRVLAGTARGRRVLTELLERIGKEPVAPEPVFLDFQDVEVATASFLRESVLEFRDAVRRRRSNFYPVVANAGETVEEELGVLVGQSRDVLMLCTIDDAGQPSEPRLAGDLEPKQRITYDLVREHGETDAGELMRLHSESDDVGQTAWNNRLSALARLGLLVELRGRSRGKRYRPLLTTEG